MNNSSRGNQNVQAVSRAMALLRLLARHHEDGVRLPALAAATGLNRSTAFRLLGSLVQAGYGQHHEDSGTYRLGINAMQLGLTAMSRPPIVERCRPLMQAVARATEDTVFLVVRNGDFAHCLHLEQGAFPVRVITSLVGSFRLLGEGTAGQALLATLGDTELRDLYRRHAADYKSKGFTEGRIRQMVQRTLKNGYATGIDLITKGAYAVGVPFEATPTHYAALSVGAIASRLNEGRRAEVARIMNDALRKGGFTPFF
ncbi:IclR family transcriptional regulator [Achromobacter denitrificans]|uniref:IclR family transcriptional regulator n=1 Tax=Achromobacter denitrificans TaxID=32002 RepID=UPI001664EA7E|nr:IclR family transcriptional regulator [Achromobacter denitrificans]MDF3944131.1 IclR family transcriptional regulator [Achromobacter denitrificans]GFN28352.1 transcriptional regulator [Achromobacter denitrificans]